MSSSKGESASDFVVQRVNPLADPDWDSVMATCPGAGFFHGTSWLRVLQATYGFTPGFFLSSRPGKSPVVLPMMEVNSWLTGRRGVGLPFTDECAPLCADAAVFASLFNHAVSLARQRGWKYLECRGGRPLLGDVPASTSFFGHSLDLRANNAKFSARPPPAGVGLAAKAGQVT